MKSIFKYMPMILGDLLAPIAGKILAFVDEVALMLTLETT
jgi:hypothetical protein